eukprot:scaffold32099_cov50-Attheya_sp.AAC.1
MVSVSSLVSCSILNQRLELVFLSTVLVALLTTGNYFGSKNKVEIIAANRHPRRALSAPDDEELRKSADLATSAATLVKGHRQQRKRAQKEKTRETMVPTQTKDGAKHPGHDGTMSQPQANSGNDIPPQSQINSKTIAGETRQKSTKSTEATNECADSATISLPLSLMKGIRHKFKDNGNDSSGSNSGASGDNSDNGNSDNSGLISIGVNSFGFNFNAEESLNGSPPNSDRNAESSGSDNDSAGKNQATVVTVSPGASLTTKLKGSARTILRENTGAMRKEHGSSHHQQKRKASSMSLASGRSSSGSDSGSGDGSSGSGSNGANSRSSKKSTVSSLTNTSNASSKSNQNAFTVVSHEDAAAAAVANLQSIANAYRASSN